MKRFVSGFVLRGLVGCGFGPLVLAVFYMIMQGQGLMRTLTVNEVCIGIVSLAALAFVAGGMNVIYQVERLPLSLAILIHGAVLYLSYFATYLANGWLERGAVPILVFSGIFVSGYLVIWGIIYVAVKRKTKKINALLREKRTATGENASAWEKN